MDKEAQNKYMTPEEVEEYYAMINNTTDKEIHELQEFLDSLCDEEPVKNDATFSDDPHGLDFLRE